MDIDGLATLVNNNHQENLRHFKHIKDMYAKQELTCNSRIEDLENGCAKQEERLDKHDIEFTKIKTVGGTIGGIWGVVTGLFAIFR